LHDFVRQPTIFDYCVRDSTLLGLGACAERDNAGTDALTIVAQAQNAIVRSVRPTPVFERHLEKVASQRSAPFFGVRHFGVARGSFWREAAVHTFQPPLAHYENLTDVLVWLSMRGVRFGPIVGTSLASRIRGLIASTLDENWTTAVVADRLGMSEATRRRHLAAESTTFGGLLVDARMSFAMKLLQSTDHSNRIALDIGYKSASRFAIRFRKRFGSRLQPSEATTVLSDWRRRTPGILVVCLLNDWSSRDVQGWESMPLGPFLAKSFLSTVSPWIVTMEALAPFRCAVTRRDGDPPVMPYLMPAGGNTGGGLDLQLEVLIETKSNGDAMRLSRSSSRHSYWSLAQMLTHHTENGCNLLPVDLLATGTQSGPTDGEKGCLMELSFGGRVPIRLSNGETREMLEDGDTVILRAWGEREGFARIGLGECRGTVLPARVV
jgi:2-keto-4-pentenoate hydratase/2-oxohepta-3-ene-1,7-dioic acid hydratase in catechol pathway